MTHRRGWGWHGSDTAKDFLAYRDNLNLANIPVGQLDSQKYMGVSADFDTIKTRVTSFAQMVPNPKDGKYYNYELAFDYRPANNAPTARLRNCRLIGGTNTPPGDIGLLKAYDPTHGRVELEDSTVGPAQSPHFYRNGLIGNNFKARRVEVTGVHDALRIFRTSPDNPAGNLFVDIEGIWCHDLYWLSQAQVQAGGGSTQVDGTHNDCLQLSSGAGFHMWYAYMDANTAPGYTNTYYDGGVPVVNSAFMIKPETARITAMDIRYFYARGGVYACANFAHNTAKGFSLGDAQNSLGAFKNGVFERNSTWNRTKNDWSGVQISRTTSPTTPAIDLGTGTADRNVNTDGTDTITSNGGAT